MDTETFFLFPPFGLDVRNEQLWRGAQTLTLRPKTFAVLRYLVAQRGQLVTHAALLDTVWGPTAVSDTVVRSSIRELRAILGDMAQHPQFIQTVHRRGYRFIAPVTVTATPPAVLLPTTDAPASGPALRSESSRYRPPPCSGPVPGRGIQAGDGPLLCRDRRADARGALAAQRPSTV